MNKLLVFVALLCCHSAFAQKKSFVIKNSGDTVFGDVVIKDKSFFVMNGGPVKVFAADDISTVQSPSLKGNTVVHCRLHLYSDNVVEMQLGSTPLKESDTVMVLKEIYSTAKINLYMGSDNLKTSYYFYKTPQDEKPVQLVVRYHLDGGMGAYGINTPLYRGERSKIHIEEDKGYVNQLKFLMKDCDAIPEATWDLLQYRSYSFKKLFRKYNECE